MKYSEQVLSYYTLKYIYIYNLYSAIKKNKILSSAATWMDLEDIILIK